MIEVQPAALIFMLVVAFLGGVGVGLALAWPKRGDRG